MSRRIHLKNRDLAIKLKKQREKKEKIEEIPEPQEIELPKPKLTLE